MLSFAREFYNSAAWQRCRDSYRVERSNLCERCLARGLIVPGAEVHHKIKLTQENIDNPAISLNWDNLELLCKQCHMEEHKGTRWRADELGHIEI